MTLAGALDDRGRTARWVAPTVHHLAIRGGDAHRYHVGDVRICGDPLGRPYRHGWIPAPRRSPARRCGCWRRCTSSICGPEYPSRRISFQIADGRQLRSPIPAELARSLTQVWAAGDGLRDAGERPDGHFLRRIAHRRSERDQQFVGVGPGPPRSHPLTSQRYCRNILSVRPNSCPLSVTVARVSNPSQTNQTCSSASSSGAAGKAIAVLPVGLGHPLDAFLVIGHKRVRDAPGRQQVGVDAARDGGGQPFVRARLPETARRQLKIEFS